MGRLIDADALDNALTALRFNTDGELVHWGDRKDWCLHGSEIEKLIADAPTVDAEPVRHGRWQVNEMFGYKDMTCLSCGWLFEYYGGLEEEWNYCPRCGAKMDGERREDEQPK